MYTFQTMLIHVFTRIISRRQGPFHEHFWVEALMKHFRLRFHTTILCNNSQYKIINSSINYYQNYQLKQFLFGLYKRPQLFPRVHYAACQPNHIKLVGFIFSSWTNTRQVMQKCMCSQTQHPRFCSCRNNEPACRAGSFTDLVQSQVSALM